ncbi:MAG: SDR family oxidoreductase [Planctomycetota bacterium]|nr:SDR family oxidoreductase [Planctomycetota bacterium]
MGLQITGAQGKALQGRAALISGGGTGIGFGIARAFAREGAMVALTGRRMEKLQEAVAALKAQGARALAVAGDVSRPEDCRRMVAETVKSFGALHVLVNNAGIARFGKLEETSDEDLAAIVDVNLKGPMYLSKAALAELKKQGASGGACILNVSSAVTSLAVRGFAVYSAAKAGLDHLTRCLALDSAADGVRVNAILPGMVETPIFAASLGSEAAAKEMLKHGGARHPLGRIGQPEDIAEMAVLLCSAASSWTTGAVVPVDGGIGLGP